MVWNINTLVPLITFTIYGVLLFVVISSRPQTASRRNFLWFLLSMSVYALSAFFLLIDTSHSLTWMRIFASSGIPTMISLFYFTQTIVEENVRFTRYVLYYGLISIILSLSTNLVIVSAFVEQSKIHYEFGKGFLFISGPSYLLVIFSIYLLIKSYQKSQDIVQRNRLLYLIIALSIIPVISLVNFTPLGKYPLDIAGYGLAALLIAYSILRYQLLNIRIVIRQGMLYSIPTILIGTTYFLVIILFLNIFSFYTGAEIFLTSLVVAIITALIAEPLRERAQAFIDQLFFRETYNSTQMLQTLSGSVATILDIYEITTMILEEVSTTLHIPLAAFFLRDEETGIFQLTTQIGLEDIGNLSFRRGHPIVLWLSTHILPLGRQDVEVLPQFQSLWKREWQDLEKLDASLFIPIKVQSQLVGIFAWGSKRSEQDFSAEDKLTLSTVANQTAVAIENARLFTAEHSRRKEIDNLYNLSHQLVSADNLETVLKTVAQHARESIQVTYTRILSREADGDYYCRAIYPEQNLAGPL
ncbi:MAG: GAF domain-containing protein, partial [Anaerolineales bacterium]|nr:GAF domain-containing protein [Anaerolineales bacterium]